MPAQTWSRRRSPAWGAAAAVVALLAGCSGASGDAAQGRGAPGAAARERAPAAAGELREVVFRGACDASGAVPLSGGRFVVADDEDNVLRVYDAEAGGPPVAATDLSAPLRLPWKGRKRRSRVEMDLEAATRVGDRAYWLSSHGRNEKGRRKEERLRFFATTLPDAGGAIGLAGRAYDDLLGDLVAAPELAGFELAAAAERAPKEPGGLNIEGLTAAPDGGVWLAFRNPIPGGRALLVPLANPRQLVDAPDARRARFGAPVLLDLGGRGVRSLSWWRGRYVLIAGHHGSGGGSQLFTWRPGEEPVAVTSVDLRDHNPEGFFTPEERDEILVVSDDGERRIDGRPCKKLDDPAAKRFRGVWLTLPDA